MVAIRPPAVAGSFYPGDRNALQATVEQLLATESNPMGRRPLAVIAPHAGYVYSGPVAARAFATLSARGADIRRVVVIGPAHFVAFRGIAAPKSSAFRTPLGDVPIDRAAIEALAALPQVQLTDAPHRDEHALEVELPFLQTVLGRFALVPLVVGSARPTEVAEVLARVWADDTLLVVSSDLSHYLDYETANRRDTATANAIEGFSAIDLAAEDACGYLPIAGLLLEAARRGCGVERLDLRNSGDTAGPKNSVVGYGAWAFYAA